LIEGPDGAAADRAGRTFRRCRRIIFLTVWPNPFVAGAIGGHYARGTPDDSATASIRGFTCARGRHQRLGRVARADPSDEAAVRVALFRQTTSGMSSGRRQASARRGLNGHRWTLVGPFLPSHRFGVLTAVMARVEPAGAFVKYGKATSSIGGVGPSRVTGPRRIC